MQINRLSASLHRERSRAAQLSGTFSSTSTRRLFTDTSGILSEGLKAPWQPANITVEAAVHGGHYVAQGSFRTAEAETDCDRQHATSLQGPSSLHASSTRLACPHICMQQEGMMRYPDLSVSHVLRSTSAQQWLARQCC